VRVSRPHKSATGPQAANQVPASNTAGPALNRQEEPPGRRPQQPNHSWKEVPTLHVHRNRFRRVRLRRRGSLTPAETAAALAAGVAFAWYAHATAAAGTGHVTSAGTGLTVASVPSGSSYTPLSWAAALLSSGGWPRSACNLSAVTAWEAAEGGNWANTARFNPLDTTQAEPGSWSMNSVNVQAYPSWAEGFTATLTTLRNGRYGPVLAALAAGDDAQAVADAVAASPWGTGPFAAGC
jgi:hypothetical protein